MKHDRYPNQCKWLTFSVLDDIYDFTIENWWKIFLFSHKFDILYHFILFWTVLIDFFKHVVYYGYPNWCKWNKKTYDYFQRENHIFILTSIHISIHIPIPVPIPTCTTPHTYTHTHMHMYNTWHLPSPFRV